MSPNHCEGNSLVKLLGEGAYFSESCFSENVVAEEITNINMEGTIKRWNDDDQCQLCQEATQCLGLNCTKIQELCF